MLATPKQIEGEVYYPGMMRNGFRFNGDHFLAAHGIDLTFDERYPFSPGVGQGIGDWFEFMEEWPDLPGSYGVCDSPEQFRNKFGEMLERYPKKLVVMFDHVEKEPGEGGWRWHKWGEYVGEGQPTTEYLADEDGFDGGVYVYHVYDVSRYV